MAIPPFFANTDLHRVRKDFLFFAENIALSVLERFMSLTWLITAKLLPSSSQILDSFSVNGHSFVLGRAGRRSAQPPTKKKRLHAHALDFMP